MFVAEASTVVNCGIQKAWDYVSRYDNFDQFMSHVKEVKMLSGDTSEWHLAGPAGIPVTWQAITSVMEPPTHLAWHSVKGTLDTKGFIKLAQEGEGTKITVHVEYDPPAGAMGEAFAGLFKDPQTMLEQDLSKLGDILSGNAVSIAKDQSQQDGMGKGVGGMMNTVTDFATEKPLVTLLSAVAIGFVLGRMTGRRD
ncbi:MAG TPA: SRPBCC family protein [Deinococcales bacterium]|nr:SRPBCC family protein [Deinococcales bacterium]